MIDNLDMEQLREQFKGEIKMLAEGVEPYEQFKLFEMMIEELQLAQDTIEEKS